jgi:hypothetical protein
MKQLCNTSTTNFEISIHFMDNTFNLFAKQSMFYVYLSHVNIPPEDNLGKIETCWSFDGLCVKIYIIVTFIAFVAVT